MAGASARSEQARRRSVVGRETYGRCAHSLHGCVWQQSLRIEPSWVGNASQPSRPQNRHYPQSASATWNKVGNWRSRVGGAGMPPTCPWHCACPAPITCPAKKWHTETTVPCSLRLNPRSRPHVTPSAPLGATLDPTLHPMDAPSRAPQKFSSISLTRPGHVADDRDTAAGDVAL
eukprot:531193-Pyramimonas_sp.AAC.1